MGLNYYNILGVSRKATRNEIKKMYRELALKFHPDKNNSPVAPEKFRQVTEAYVVLSDKIRREEFDNRGGFSGPSFVDDDLASNIFKKVISDNMDLIDELLELRMNVGKMVRLRRRSSDKPRLPIKRAMIQDPPIYKELRISLEEINSGCTKKMKITKQVFNSDMKTTKKVEKLLTIDIKPGTKEGTSITFPFEGDENVGTVAADIVFVLKDRAHALYKRDEENNLIYTMKITLRQALVGDVFEIPTLTPPKTLHLNTRNEVIKPELTKTFPSEGLPIPNNPGTFGNLVLKFDIIFPEQLSTLQKDILRNTLPQS